MQEKKKGFTLIELLIVIGIIAILAAAIVVIIQPGQQFLSARESTRWSHVNGIVSGVYAYMTTNQAWPNCVLSATTSSVDVVTCTDLVADTGTLPRDPTEGNATSTGYNLLANMDPVATTTIVSITVSSTAAESNVTLTQ